MREILFRGKIKETKAWKFGFIAKHKFEFEKEEVFIIEEEKTGSWADVIPETIGQFTGLTDKNGKKIFEGDIVKVCSGWNENATIVYDDAVARFLAKFKKWGAKSISQETVFEVIGNIYDNPELLK